VSAPREDRPTLRPARRSQQARASRRRKRVYGPGTILAVVGILAFTLFPIYFMLTTAFSARASSGTDNLIPRHLTFRHFTEAMSSGFSHYLVNSAFVTIAVVVLSCLLALLGAVAMARFRFRMRTTMLVLVLVVQMLPAEALVIPLFLQMKDLRMLNSLIGLTIVYIAFALPFAIWNLRGFVAAVPVELEEAAYLDGCSWFRMFRSVLLPLVTPGLIATSAFSFVMAWEEFTFAMTFLSEDSKMTVGIGLKQFFGAHVNDWGGLMAASTMVTIPVMVVFVLAQRKLAAGLVAGAVK
jgi:N,N'-diacetylchitobiose transport system permease protein